MKKKILLIELSSILLALLILFTVSVFYISNGNKNGVKETLRNINNITTEVFDGTNFKDTIKYITNENKDYRVTIIDKEGNVMADSLLIEAENHIDREELQNIENFVTRYSNSLKINMMYYATMDDGYYVRTAIPVTSINTFIINYSIIGASTLIGIVLVTILVTSLLFNKTMTPIKEEINKVEKTLNKPLTDCRDFNVLSAKISVLAKEFNTKVESLNKSEAKSNFILDNMIQGLVLLNKIGNIELINQCALNIFNEDYSNIINKNYIYLIRDIDAQNSINNAIKQLKDDKTTIELNNHKYMLYINIINNDWTKNTNISLLIVDITLESEISELKKQFFNNASHELKSPITSILGYQQLIKEGILSTKEEIEDATNRTIKEAKRMNNLIIEMLDLARLESTDQIKTEQISVNGVIDEILNEFSLSLKEKNITVKYNEDFNLSVLSNYNDLYKLLKNLIENAIIYNNINGIIDIKLDKNSISISDTGIGISNEDLEHIFERFYRVDKGRSRSNNSTGLGLSIVKHICLVYNYKISVKSKLGKGTTFKIEL